MKRLLSVAGVSAAVCLAHFAGFRPVQGAPVAPGSITGTMTREDKRPLNNPSTLIVSGTFIDLQQFAHETIYNPGDTQFSRGVLNDGKSASRQQADQKMGGLFGFDNLAPGVYNVLVEGGTLDQKTYRPQRIVGIVVKSGQTTNLDITYHEGQSVEFLGEPKCNVANGLKNAWLEGTITAPDGHPMLSAQTLIATGVRWKISNPKLGQMSAEADKVAGGFFSCASLKPGTYDMTIEKGNIGTKYYKPLLIRNLRLMPGVRTILNITMHEGQGLERLDSPPNPVNQKLTVNQDH